VTPQLNLESRPEVFVVGDMAYLESYNGDHPYPMVAQVAIQQGRLAGKNVAALEHGRAPRSFRCSDKGQMAIIGRRYALVDGIGLRLHGRIAWIACLALHLLNLPGIKNRLSVLLDWIAVYTWRTRGAGIMTRPDHRVRVDPAQPHALNSECQISRQARHARR
jgi:NADH dehydrogenase